MNFVKTRDHIELKKNVIVSSSSKHLMYFGRIVDWFNCSCSPHCLPGILPNDWLKSSLFVYRKSLFSEVQPKLKWGFSCQSLSKWVFQSLHAGDSGSWDMRHVISLSVQKHVSTYRQFIQTSGKVQEHGSKETYRGNLLFYRRTDQMSINRKLKK